MVIFQNKEYLQQSSLFPKQQTISETQIQLQKYMNKRLMEQDNLNEDLIEEQITHQQYRLRKTPVAIVQKFKFRDNSQKSFKNDDFQDKREQSIFVDAKKFPVFRPNSSKLRNKSAKSKTPNLSTAMSIKGLQSRKESKQQIMQKFEEDLIQETLLKVA